MTRAVKIGRAASGLWIAGCATVAVATLWHTMQSFVPMQWNDQWSEVGLLCDVYSGREGLTALLRPHNEHVIFAPRLFFLMDLLAFHGTNYFLVALIVAVQALTCALLIREAYRAPELSAPVRLFLAGAYLLFAFSGVQIPNFVWGFQLTFMLVYAAFVLSLVALVATQDALTAGRPARGWLAVSVAGATVATFSMSNGILAWPILIVLSMLGSHRPRMLLLLAGVGLVAILCWYNLTPPDEQIGAALVHPGRLLTFMALFLGTAVNPLSWRVVGRVGAVGVGLALLLSLYWLVRRKEIDRFTRIHLGVMWYVLGAGLAVALGRSHWGMDVARNDRYGTAALLFWASVVSLLLHRPGGRPHARPFERGLTLLAVATAALWLVLPASLRAYTKARAQAEQQRFDALALVSGVYDGAALERLCRMDPSLPPPLVDFAKRRRLGIFAQDWTATIGRPLRVDAASLHARAGGVVHMQRLPYPAHGSPLAPGLRVSGSVAERDGVPAAGLRVWVVDDTASVCGVGQFVAAEGIPEPGAGDASAEWQGYAQDPGPATLTALAPTDSSGQAFRLLGRCLTRPLETFSSAARMQDWRAGGGWVPHTSTGANLGFTQGYSFVSARTPDADTDTTALESPPFACGDAAYLAVPYLWSGSKEQLTIRLIRADTGETVEHATLTGRERTWTTWLVSLEGLGPFAVRLLATDAAPGHVGLLAIGEPRCIPSVATAPP